MTTPTPTPDATTLAGLRRLVAEYSATDQARTQRLDSIRSALTPADRAAERTDVAFLVAELDRVMQAHDEVWRLVDQLEQEPDVLALPPEPPVGETVEVVGGGHRGLRLTRIDRPGTYRWRPQRTPSGEFRGQRYDWFEVLDLAGPAGVRVVKGGE